MTWTARSETRFCIAINGVPRQMPEKKGNCINLLRAKMVSESDRIPANMTAARPHTAKSSKIYNSVARY